MHGQEVTAWAALFQEFSKHLECDRILTKKNDPFDGVLQLTYVARPLVSQEIGKQIRWQPQVAPPVFRFIFFREVLHQMCDISRTLAERRQVDRNDQQPVIEILAK